MKTKENVKESNFTRSTRSGISLIVLVITIIVIIILAAAIIISLNNNNPIMEANKARYESDRANIQAVFTNAVAKVMAKNQSTISISAGQINTITGGKKEVEGEVAYTLTYAQNVNNSTGKIVFDKKPNTDTVFYTGKKLPIYAAGETKWYVDEEGNISLEVAGTKYGSGEISDGTNEYGFYFDKLYVHEVKDEGGNVATRVGIIFYEDGSGETGEVDEEGNFNKDTYWQYLPEGSFTYETGKLSSELTGEGIVLNSGLQIKFNLGGEDGIFTLFNPKIVPVSSTPQVPAGATPVKWDADYNEIETTEDDPQWYNYKAQTSTTENGGTSKWANIKLQDGSYFVWIPRYAYKIDKANKTIDVKFTKYENGTDVAIDGTSLEGYIVHPVFTNDVAAGGWDKELNGIWVAKYEAGEANSNEYTEDTVVASTKVSGKNLPVIKPNRSSHLWASIGEVYDLAKEYNPTLNSHMARNSEWGAVAYLAHSQYGRNGTNIRFNNKRSHITGYAANPGQSYQSSTENTPYNTDNGVLASTTGNIYGIYDMVGGCMEYIAGYVYNSTIIDSFSDLSLVKDGQPNVSSKYKTVYLSSGENDDEYENYSLLENSSRVGEGIWEVTDVVDNSLYLWNGNRVSFPSSWGPFFSRDDCYYMAGENDIFKYSKKEYSYYVADGGYYPLSFRMILVN